MAEGRTCGSCMMCCKLLQIDELNKPVGVWCSHVLKGTGCGIYASRPQICQAFECGWLQDPSFGPEWKPDRAKLIVYLQRGGAHLQVAVDPSFPNAWLREPYHGRIRQWSREGAEKGRFVFVRIGPRMIAVLPDRDVDMGRVDAADEIEVSRKPAAAGFAYDVQVRRAASA